MTGFERHPELLDRDRAAIFVVDVQERFARHIEGFSELVEAIRLLVRGARELGVPVAFSEQYPQGLGRTVERLSDVLDGMPSFEKLEISSVASDAWDELPAELLRRDQLVVVGIETHVCVRQTALDALHAGWQVHLPVDGISSRSPLDREVALERLQQAGALATTVEAVLFDMLGCAGSDEFKAVQRMIKERDAASAATPA